MDPRRVEPGEAGRLVAPGSVQDTADLAQPFPQAAHGHADLLAVGHVGALVGDGQSCFAKASQVLDELLVAAGIGTSDQRQPDTGGPRERGGALVADPLAPAGDQQHVTATQRQFPTVVEFQHFLHGFGDLVGEDVLAPAPRFHAGVPLGRAQSLGGGWDAQHGDAELGMLVPQAAQETGQLRAVGDRHESSGLERRPSGPQHGVDPLHYRVK